MDEKGTNRRSAYPPAPALKEVVVVNPTPTPHSHSKTQRFAGLSKLADESSRCSLDPLGREVNVTALTDDKALMMISCEAGACHAIDFAWIVSR